MAITLDVDLGSATLNGAGTITRTTSVAAAAGATIFVMVSYYTTGTVPSTLTIGGTGATRDKHVTNGSDMFDIWRLNVAGGLASGSAISQTLAVGAGGVLMSCVSFNAVTTSSPLITTSSSTGTGTAWSSGSGTNTGVADAVFIGGAGNEDITNPTTSTATSGTELHDVYIAAAQQGFATGYKIVSTIASDSVAGNFSNANSTANTGGLAIYAGIGVATIDAIEPRDDFEPARIGPF